MRHADEMGQDTGQLPVETLRTLVDGIFAIILTLLVLDLRLPENFAGGQLRHELLAMRWSLFAFMLAFFYLTIAWVSTRRWYDVELHGHIKWAHVPLVLLPTATMTLVPLATSALARSMHDHQDLVTATQFFVIIMFCNNLFATLVGVVFARDGSLATDRQLLVPAGAVARPLLRWVLPYAALVGVAYLSPLAVLAWVLHDTLVIMNPRWSIAAILGRRVDQLRRRIRLQRGVEGAHSSHATDAVGKSDPRPPVAPGRAGRVRT